MSINPTGTAAAPTSSPQLSQVNPLDEKQQVRFQQMAKLLETLSLKEFELKNAQPLEKFNKYLFGPWVEYIERGTSMFSSKEMRMIEKITSLPMQLLDLIDEYGGDFDVTQYHGSYIEYRPQQAILADYNLMLRIVRSYNVPFVIDKLAHFRFGLIRCGLIDIRVKESLQTAVLINLNLMHQSSEHRLAIQLSSYSEADNAKHVKPLGFIMRKALGGDVKELMSNIKKKNEIEDKDVIFD